MMMAEMPPIPIAHVNRRIADGSAVYAGAVYAGVDTEAL